MKKKDEKFNFVNLPSECKDPSIKEDDFKLVQSDKTIHDQKFETKPTTFLKDCFRRFVKNKSSVVAAFILGILILMSIFVPIIFKTSDVHDTDKSHPELYYLEPKLFKAGTGFWDGTKKMKDIPVDTSKPREEWGPDYNRYNKNAVSDLVIGEEQYTTTPNEYSNGGFIQFGYYGDLIPEDVDYVRYATNPAYLDISENVNFGESGLSFKITNFVTYDKDKLSKTDEKTKTYPARYEEAKSALFFAFEKGTEDLSFALTTYKYAHDVGGSDETIDVLPLLNDFIDEYNATVEKEEEKITDLKLNKPRVEIRVLNAKDDKYACTLIKSVNIEVNSSVKEVKRQFERYSFKDGNSVYIRPSVYGSITDDTDEAKAKKEANSGIWTNFSNTRYAKDTDYLCKYVPCSFTYDTYEAALGKTTTSLAYSSEIFPLKQKNIIKLEITRMKDEDGKWVADPNKFECKILDPDNCPFIEEFKAEDVVYDQKTGIVKYVNCLVYKYKMNPYNLDKMPTFLLGTDKTGRDMFIHVFKGLRTSLLLGVVASAVCFVFGLFYGAISGYFGGAVDLIMERFTDILSGIPWIVVMTLTILKLGDKKFFAEQASGQLMLFLIALCLTGWIGTAATTRTQFYRFRGREYVLASRTLGASHARLITRHILPNAMGTIITSAVLMVPSIIFSEATISYLGLGLKGQSSLGVVLSDNQVELTNHPYLLIFPAIVIALLMISFNLFGNGLRDAVNPSLKGEGE